MPDKCQENNKIYKKKLTPSFLNSFFILSIRFEFHFNQIISTLFVWNTIVSIRRISHFVRQNCGNNWNGHFVVFPLILLKTETHKNILIYIAHKI